MASTFTSVAAPIAPGPAVGGVAFASGVASTFTSPSRAISVSTAGVLEVIMNQGMTLPITVVAGQWLEISATGVTAGSAVDGVAFW